MRCFRSTRERDSAYGVSSARSAPRSSRSTGRNGCRTSGKASASKGMYSGVSNSARTSRSARMTGGKVFRKESSAPPAPRGRDGESGGVKVAVRFRPLRSVSAVKPLYLRLGRWTERLLYFWLQGQGT